MTPQEFLNRKIIFTNITYDTAGCTRAEIAEAKREGDFLPTMSIKIGDFLDQYGDMDTSSVKRNKDVLILYSAMTDAIFERGADFISDRTGWLVASFDYDND